MPAAVALWRFYLALQSGKERGQYRFICDSDSEIGRPSHLIVDITLNKHGKVVSRVQLTGPSRGCRHRNHILAVGELGLKKRAKDGSSLEDS